MSTHSLKRFTNADLLREISADCLLSFLSPYAEYFRKRGLDISKYSENRTCFDYSSLTAILANPDEDTPRELVDALYYVHEMATVDGMDFLLSEAEKRGISVDLKDPTPIDVAVRMWVYGGDIVEYAHARESMQKPRTFIYFQTDGKQDVRAKKLDADALDVLQDDLDEWFVCKHRGRGSRVFMFDKDEETWFLIRHGEPFKREGTLDDGKSSSVFYRPERYDIVVYNSRLTDLRIHAATKGEVELYRTLFGRHLFDDDKHFPNTNKYTLEPLRRDGRSSLVCSDVPGIDRITLCELEFEEDGFHRNVTRWKSHDIFDMLESTGESIPLMARLSKAVFKVVFSGSKGTRTVCIHPSNIAQFQRDSDESLIELWLELRGFTPKASPEDYHVEFEEKLLVTM